MAAEFSRGTVVELEEEAQHLWISEDDLAVRDIEEECLPHPLAPLLQALRIKGGIKSAGATGEHQKTFFGAMERGEVGESAARVAAVKVELHNFLDNR